MAKTGLEKIASIDDEIVLLKKKQKDLLVKHNAKERKERNHRLCKRGGLIEKELPEL
jgi:hypothetical protein